MEESFPRKIIPVVITNAAICDKKLICLKKQFERELQKIDEEITRFSANLTHLQPSATSKQCSISESNKRDKEADKEADKKGEGAKTKEETKEADIVKNEVMSEQQMLDNPPLVEGDGDEKNLKLQFDLSQFDPEEVKVTILEDILLVEASHVEKKSSCTIYREYARQVQLPKGLNPNIITSALSPEGVLTVQAFFDVTEKESTEKEEGEKEGDVTSKKDEDDENDDKITGKDEIVENSVEGKSVNSKYKDMYA